MIIRAFLLIPLIILVYFSPQSLADNRATKEKELKQLSQRIEKLKNSIEKKENSKSGFVKELRTAERKIGKMSQKIAQSNKAIKSQKKALTQLEQEKSKIRQRIGTQNQALGRQIHSAYTLGQQEQAKLLFSQKDANQLQRNLIYYQYFSRYRLDVIDQSKANFTLLLENERKIIDTKKALQKELDQQKKRHAELTKDRKKRKMIIANLDKDLKKEGKYLSRLEENAENLRQLIESIQDILTDIPTPKTPHKKFAELRGKLSWPVKGQVAKLFGKPKPPSNLRWQGVMIKARSGNNVRSISHGRVAFADWLRGMGNLVIVDHGDGYISLYGHNESIYKSAGEWVEPGEIIASIGNSGGQKEPGVYFEIRYRGKPKNPTRWCHSKNWFASL